MVPIKALKSEEIPKRKTGGNLWHKNLRSPPLALEMQETLPKQPAKKQPRSSGVDLLAVLYPYNVASSAGGDSSLPIAKGILMPLVPAGGTPPQLTK